MALEKVGALHGFSRTYRASTERIASLQIPLPPLDIQQKIVDECKKVDEEVTKAKKYLDETVEMRPVK